MKVKRRSKPASRITVLASVHRVCEVSQLLLEFGLMPQSVWAGGDYRVTAETPSKDDAVALSRLGGSPFCSCWGSWSGLSLELWRLPCICYTVCVPRKRLGL